MMDEYFLVELSTLNYSDVARLYFDVHGTTKSRDEIHTKYGKAFTGGGSIGYIAYSQGTKKPVALYVVFPQIVRTVSNDSFLVAQSGDTMTSPSHRGRGLFIRLAKKTYELSRAKGVSVVYGFPNSASFSGFQKKLNWIFPYNMSVIKWMIPRINKNVPCVDFDLAKLNFLKNNFIVCDLSIDCFAGSSSTVLRSKESISIRKNDFFVEKKGLGAWVSISGNELKVGDIVSDKGINPIRRFLVWLSFVSACRKSGIRQIVFYFSPNISWIVSGINWLGMSKKSLPYGYLVLIEDLNLNPEKFSFVYGDYDTF